MNKLTNKVIERIATNELSLLARDKGFDQSTYYGYDDKGVLKQCHIKEGRIILFTASLVKTLNTNNYNVCLAPYLSILQSWLNDTYNIRVEVTSLIDASYSYAIYHIEQDGKYANQSHFVYTEQRNYHKALNMGLLDALQRLIIN